MIALALWCATGTLILASIIGVGVWCICTAIQDLRHKQQTTGEHNGSH